MPQRPPHIVERLKQIDEFLARSAVLLERNEAWRENLRRERNEEENLATDHRGNPITSNNSAKTNKDRMGSQEYLSDEQEEKSTPRRPPGIL